ncbi:MAG: hypothetical protein F6K25_15095 [Okeania sp. SIO2G4]|uniref:hypothetical protein n=1 Tax=unclassified Okeania TaxID=2634635 RepID=UPI0013B9899C|nr:MULTISPECIES: hypothetical protein [unclassified Okeania]NEP39247.1 hypothetical protein [Okeania sp. SIO2H7]NEP73253.1 hypothetical protein [Okeania sp. SIO2G5]NEP94117.1 hypothetical protein [Okeania sp. SIO2F5]NEQ91947.1 hypothetical protein [Okeania sp. SIO2G4]
MIDSNRKTRSEKISVTMSAGTYRQLEERALQEERTLVSLALFYIESGLARSREYDVLHELSFDYKKALAEQQARIKTLEAKIDNSDPPLDNLVKKAIIKSISGQTLNNVDISLICEYIDYDQELLPDLVYGDQILEQNADEEEDRKSASIPE